MKLNFKGFKDESLCNHCDYGQVMITSKGDRVVICNSWGRQVLPNITECSTYAPKGSLNEYELRKIAWILEVEKGKVVGFSPPKQEEK